MNGMKFRITIKELLLFAGILVALVAFLLYWTELPLFKALVDLSSYREILPHELRQLVSKTFAALPR